MNKKIALLVFIPLMGLVLFFSFNYFKNLKTPHKIPLSSPIKEETTSEPYPFKFALAEYKRLISDQNVSYEPVKVTPKIPPYNLPLEINQIANFNRFNSKVNLPKEAISLLLKNGFAVFDLDSKINRFDSFYNKYREFCEDFYCSKEEQKNGPAVPFFITTDTFLHYYHLIFSSTLLKLERDLFFDNLWTFNKKMLEKAIEDYKNANDNLIKEASRRNIAYFFVALKLLQPKENQITTLHKLKEEGDLWYTNVIYWCCNEHFADAACYHDINKVDPTCIRNMIEQNLPNEFSKNDLIRYKLDIPQEIIKAIPEANEELKLIEEAKEFAFSPLFIYKEDYTQYVPRGHYTRGEKLKNYFKAMMWISRMTMLAKGSENLKDKESKCLKDGIISKENAQIQTLQAILISKHFKEEELLQKIWQKIYKITSFFVGFSDDLGPYEYVSVIDKVLNGNELKSELTDKIQEFIINELNDPKIYSGLGDCVLSGSNLQERIEEAKEYLKRTKGFRLMGQRYVVDSYLMSNLVSPYSGYYTGEKNNLPFTAVLTERGSIVRGFPRGLDIMALLGSERAKFWLKTLKDDQFSNYYQAFNALNNEISSLSLKDWLNNLYSSWLFTLKPLLEKFGNGYPTFMQQESYEDKLLNTALASWTELRHDTILYVKQSYTMAEGGIGPEILIPRSYLEPIPEFYNRLLFLIKVTKNGLNNLLTAEEYQQIFNNNYSRRDILDEFKEILEKLLTISIKEVENKELTEEEYAFLDHFNEELNWLTKNLLRKSNKSGDIMETADDFLKTTLIADVHTEGNTREVLEEGTGYLKAIVVAYKLPNGQINIGLGPVFSYYEFKQPTTNRLTDEKWQEILNTNPPKDPEWTKTFTISK